MDVAAASTQYSLASVQTSVGISMMKQSMDAQSEIAEMIVQELMSVDMMQGHMDISV